MELDLFDTFTSTSAGASSVNASSSSSSTLLPEVHVGLKKRSLEHANEDLHEEHDEVKTRRFSEASSLSTPIDPNAPKVKRPPAKTYKFKLDTFQQEAVNYIDNDESVLVAAHTSAGKTAVAEYAIAKSLRDKQRVIYTSPIKALSNQKYRDLQEEFGDVGLMTGDMTINPNASCLIMTTEILRSMLYRGSEVVREVAWVIYDEVHYMRDKERGVVWEESIILLPHKVRFVFLSATIPNAPSFVDWVSKIHHQPCHVVYTDYRPVPLQHYVFPAGAEGLYLVVDEKSKFREENFQKAMASLQGNTGVTGEDSGGATLNNNDKKSRKQISKNQNNDLTKIVRLIMERQLDPCIVFSFSKKECETYAMLMAKMDFNNDEEKVLVTQVYQNAMEALAEDDQQLPQIQTMLPLLKRGIGIHHGGLLPILKEVIEILFQEGLIKCLFATETFSIGINMPAKTVVFTATRKYDGKDFRWITSGEYIQMSGRAGRRGKDDKGIVIQMLDEKMEPDVAKNMIYGASDPLYSSYHLGYNMVLNMMRVEDADPIHVIKSSFHQFQQELNAPKLLKQAEELEREVLLMNAGGMVQQEDLIADYIQLQQLHRQLTVELNRTVMQPCHILPFLQSGRMVQVVYQDVAYGWGSVVQLKKNDVKGNNNKKLPYQASKFIGKLGPKQVVQEEYYLEVLLEVKVKTAEEIQAAQVAKGEELKFSTATVGAELEIAPKVEGDDVHTEITVVYVGFDAIAQLSAIRLNMPTNVNTKEASRLAVKKAMQEVLRRFGAKKDDSEQSDHIVRDKFTGVPLLHPVHDLGINNDQLEHLLERKEDLEERLFGDEKYASIRSNGQNMQAFLAKRKLIEEANKLRQEAQGLQSVTMREELKKMRKVLKKLEYITVEGVLTSKGRFACEVSAGDELLLTNIVFSGLFNDLNVNQTVSLLSCFVHQEHSINKDTDMAAAISKLRGDMQKPFRQLQTMAREIARVCIEMKITLEEDEFVNSFDPAMIDVTFAWASGSRFVDICKMTDIFEGSIIRSLRRLEELLRQLAAASSAIGNQELVQLFTEGATKIRRGVVFAASLYI